MNGLLLLLAITVLNQNELLPGPSGLPTAFAQQPPVMPSTQPPPGTELLPGGNNAFNNNAFNEANGCQIGWGTDASDNKFCIYIHIAPEAIDAFTRGPQGQELEARLPPDLPPSVVARMEKIIVRISKTTPERLLPIGLTDNRTPGVANAPYVRTLGNPVTIDRNNEIIPTASPSTLPPVTNGPLPSTSGSSLSNNNTGLNTGINPSYGATNPNNFGSNANNSGVMPSTLGTSTGNRDGFAPTSKLPDSMEFLRRNNVGNAPSVSNFTQGNVPNGYNNTTYNNNGVPQIANNPMANNTNDPNAAAYLNNQNTNAAINPNGLGNSQYNGAQYANNGQSGSQLSYGVQPPTITPPYAGINPVSTNVPYVAQAQTSNYPGTPISTVLPRNVTTGAQLPNTSDLGTTDSTSNFARNVGLGFLLSIIANIYLGMWLHHLRTRYRNLLGSMRGLAPSEMD